jgi:hypothetical protein
MKPFFANFLALAFVFSVLCGPALAAQPVLDTPAAPELYREKNTMGEMVLRLRFTVPKSIRDYVAQAETEAGAPRLLVEFDFRMDNGPWFLDRKPGGGRRAPLQEELLGQFKYRFLVESPGAALIKAKEYQSVFEAFMFGLEAWNTAAHTYSFRYRLVYEQMLPGEGGPEWSDRTSPWSAVATTERKK